MAIKFTKHRPNKGTFTAIWEFEDQIWSTTFKYEGDRIFRYHAHDDIFEEIISVLHYIPTNNPKVRDVKYAIVREG